MDKEIIIIIGEILSILVIAVGIGLYSVLGLFMWSIPTAIIFVGAALMWIVQGLESYLAERELRREFR